MNFTKQDLKSENNLKEVVIALRKLLSYYKHYIDYFKTSLNESVFEIQLEFISIKTLIVQSFAITEDISDQNNIKNEILFTPDSLLLNINLKNIKEDVISLSKSLSKDIDNFKTSSNELLLELQVEFKSLIALIDQRFYIPEDISHLNDIKNEVLITHVSLPPSFNLECFTKNSIELLYYYRIGLYLNLILNKIDPDVSEMHPKNVVTGLIKGTGIANLFIIKNDKSDDKIIYDSKKARYFYTKAKQIYWVYKNFPKPLVQIYYAKKVTANKLAKIKNDKAFEKFVVEIKLEVDRNYNKYNYQCDTLELSLFEESIYIGTTMKDNMNDGMISEVLRYAKNPSKSIKEQVVTNPLFKKLN